MWWSQWNAKTCHGILPKDSCYLGKCSGLYTWNTWSLIMSVSWKSPVGYSREEPSQRHKLHNAAGPGLAQLVERLAHRYSESTSSNPDNLTSATYITFVSTMRIRQPTLALKPRGDVTIIPKQGYQWPQKWTCVSQKLFLKKQNNFLMLFTKQYICSCWRRNVSPIFVDLKAKLISF